MAILREPGHKFDAFILKIFVYLKKTVQNWQKSLPWTVVKTKMKGKILNMTGLLSLEMFLYACHLPLDK